MATLTASVSRINPSGSVIEVYGSVAMSGTYTAGGDTLDLSGFGIPSSSKPLWVELQSTLGVGVQYAYKPGTTQANGKVQIFRTGSALSGNFSEFSGTVPTDTPAFCAVYEKL